MSSGSRRLSHPTSNESRYVEAECLGSHDCRQLEYESTQKAEHSPEDRDLLMK